MGIILCVAITACGVHDSEEDVPHQWQESDIYGKWKCVRLVVDTGHSYGWLPIGNEIGRTLTITETQVIDSKDMAVPLMGNGMSKDLPPAVRERHTGLIFSISTGIVMKSRRKG